MCPKTMSGKLYKRVIRPAQNLKITCRNDTSSHDHRHHRHKHRHPQHHQQHQQQHHHQLHPHHHHHRRYHHRHLLLLKHDRYIEGSKQT